MVGLNTIHNLETATVMRPESSAVCHRQMPWVPNRRNDDHSIGSGVKVGRVSLLLLPRPLTLVSLSSIITVTAIHSNFTVHFRKDHPF